tara:strand:+ start:65 stop:271 length:207 start_codon:yes stop_codon:yes gene_type:complete
LGSDYLKIDGRNRKVGEGGWGYHENGQLWWKGNYKNDKKEGDFVWYYEDGTLNKLNTGTYKNNVKISD